MNRIYLDNNATTKPDPLVVEAVKESLELCWGNPSSLHRRGQEARAVIDRARRSVARLIGAVSDSIVFTSGGTEANNLALFGVAMAGYGKKMHIITSAIEHQSVLNSCRALERLDFEVTYIPVDGGGRVDVQTVADAIRPDTAIISIMHANNDTGVMQPLRAISALARERGVTVHTDAVQSVGKIPVNVDDLGVDLLTFSAHKIRGPKGAGALFIRRGTEIDPLNFGGHQERMLRAGTENMPGIAGFGKASELALAGVEDYRMKVGRIRDRFEDAVLAGISGTRVNGDRQGRIANTSNISFDGVTAELLEMNLDMVGVEVSTGAACSAGDREPSHVLAAMGRSPVEALSSLRFSFGYDSTQDETDRAYALLEEAVGSLRSGRG